MAKSSPGNLAFVDFETSFGHVAHALLTLLAGVHGQVVDVGGLVGHLEVADATVPLPTSPGPKQTQEIPLPTITPEQ